MILPLKNDDFCSARLVIKEGAIGSVSKDDESCIKNEDFCIKNEEFRIKNEDFCIKYEDVCIKNDGLCRSTASTPISLIPATISSTFAVAVCFVYTCPRLIELFHIYMPALDRPLSDCRYAPMVFGADNKVLRLMKLYQK